jgi:tRNA G18 (ribose-2'-O)-methylase SpoU
MKMKARELRQTPQELIEQPAKRLPIYFICDNLYDTFNLGSIFRLGDALAVSGIYLCGSSETPPNNKIKAASVGTYKVVPWHYKANAETAVLDIREEVPGITVLAIEQATHSVPYLLRDYTFPLALVLGNETEGVNKRVMEMVDGVVEIPMYGVNSSLNVLVAASIVSYHAASRMDK